MLKTLLSTDRSWPLLFQRVALGLVLLPHGMQKLFGWFGGYGFDGTMGYFTGTLGMPAMLGLLVILTESLGALALIFGLGTRLAAFGTIATMLGAMVMVHGSHGFFMDWGGTKGAQGFEYHLLAIALALPLAIKGAGSYAIDRVLARFLGVERTTTARPLASAA
jgi:putative oxidoreductase